MSAPIISRKSATNISAIPPSRLEAFKGDQVDWRTENSAKNWATAYDFPAVRDKKVVQGGIPDPQFRHHAGFRLQYPARQVQGCARAPRLQLRLRLRGDEQADLLRPVQAHRQLFRRHRACLVRGCRRARNWKSWKRVQDKVPAELFSKPYTNPVGGNQQAVRNNLREALKLLHEAGYEIRNTKLINAKTGEPFQRRISGGRAGLRARRVVLQAVARAHRHDRVGPHRRFTRNMRTGCGSGITTSSSRPGASRCRPATSSAASGARRPPTCRARAI